MAGDADGYKRGAMGIDGRKGEGFVNKGRDDGNKPMHDILDRIMEVGERGERYAGVGGYSAPLPQGGGKSPPRYAPKGDFGTKPVAAASPTGKFAKKPGRAGNQRSGA